MKRRDASSDTSSRRFTFSRVSVRALSFLLKTTPSKDIFKILVISNSISIDGLRWPLSIAYGFAALMFLPMEAFPKPGETVPNYFGNLMETALMFFASGAFWSLTGMTFAALTDSKYMAYASPFVLFYLLIILYERYFDKLFVLYPREWLNPSPRWVFGKIGVAVLLIEFSLLMALAFAYAAKRRLERI